jgi:hypothetical protein
MEVFLVHHVHVHDEGDEDVKLIGVYSTRENAEQAMVRAGKLPGFCDAPEGFSIDQHRVNEDNWTDGYVTVTNRVAP